MAVLNFPAAPTDQQVYVENGVNYIWQAAGGYWSTSTAAADLDSRYVNLSGDTMTGNLTVPSQNGGPLAGFRNVLINGDFRIYQRGFSGDNSTGPGPYFAGDRWIMRDSAGSSNGTWTIRSGADPAFENTQASHLRMVWQPTTNVWGIQQRIETTNALHLQGGKVSLSFVSSVQLTSQNIYLQSSKSGVSGTPYPFTMTEHTNPYGSVGFLYKGTVTIPSNAWSPGESYVSLFWFQNQDIVSPLTIDVGCFQLEPGPVATPFEHRPIGAELALCQRYYQALKVTAGTFGNGSTPMAGVFFNTSMRTAPTLVKVNAGTSPGGIMEIEPGTASTNGFGLQGAQGTSSSPAFSRLKAADFTADAEL